MIGHNLGGRYVILDRIGGGGMALVYKAHDNILQRKVAIKVLRQQYANDEEFVSRFRREALSAASLSHPNVVNIFDVGQEGDIHYIVMEYIEGTNLNERIKTSAPLPLEEAVDIAMQICSALAHAHENGIIHRDIKPHNILIGVDGRVKVTDFGIARAAASTDITQTGSVLGSVHYFSPEHAKGVSQGEKSDLYSLGVVLYQMLTNKLPFLGDSPISIALKHLQEHVEEPRKVNPSIPQSVENIILRAMRKNPDDRYASAEEMLADLKTCLLPERRNEPKLVIEDEEFDDEATRVMPAVRTSSLDTGEQTPSDKQKRWKKPAIWTGVLVAIVLLVWMGLHGLFSLFDVPDVVVPDVTGLPLEEAIDILEQHRLKVELPLRYVFDDEVEEGIVIDQTRKGMTVKENSYIQLTVSNGPQMMEMKRYIGMPVETVQAELIKAGISADQITIQTRHDDQPEGTVIDQYPAPDELYNPRQVSVILTVSDGPGTFAMPDLTNRKLSEAEAMIIRHNLKLAEDGIRYEPSFEVEEGIVMDQFPAQPGEMVEPGTEIVLYVSSGYPDEVLEPVVHLRVEPEEEGEPSTVTILYKDASGDNIEWGTREISRPHTFPVRVLVMPNADAVITYYVNGRFGDSIQVTYEMASENLEIEYPEPDREQWLPEEEEDLEVYHHEEDEETEDTP